MSHEKRFVRVPIYIDPATPTLCCMVSRGDDGCAAFHHDDDGDVFCGAFGKYLLVPDDSQENSEYLRVRCDDCLMSELTQ